MSNKIIEHHGAKIHSCDFNQRVYLADLGNGNTEKVISKVDEVAQDKNYSKVFAKVPESKVDEFFDNGYYSEALVPGFFKGDEAVHFAVKYFDQKRRELTNREVVVDVISKARSEQTYEKSDHDLDESFFVRELNDSDAEDMAKIYDKIFQTYPFPIHDPNYLKQVMGEHVRSFGVFYNDRLVALAACEMDFKNLNVEMTDFATLNEFRGKKLAYLLLEKMEQKMREEGFFTAYTIARSLSFGMNLTFSRKGYEYSGLLKNNTNISGSIESMNVWYKTL